MADLGLIAVFYTFRNRRKVTRQQVLLSFIILDLSYNLGLDRIFFTYLCQCTHLNSNNSPLCSVEFSEIQRYIHRSRCLLFRIDTDDLSNIFPSFWSLSWWLDYGWLNAAKFRNFRVFSGKAFIQKPWNWRRSEWFSSCVLPTLLVLPDAETSILSLPASRAVC